MEETAVALPLAVPAAVAAAERGRPMTLSTMESQRALKLSMGFTRVTRFSSVGSCRTGHRRAGGGGMYGVHIYTPFITAKGAVSKKRQPHGHCSHLSRYLRRTACMNRMLKHTYIYTGWLEGSRDKP